MVPSTGAKTSRRPTGSSWPLVEILKLYGTNVSARAITTTATAAVTVQGNCRAATSQRLLPIARQTGIRNI